MTKSTVLSRLKTGHKFVVADSRCLEKMGIDSDQQPFVVHNVDTPVLEYVYVKDRNGIMYLMGPGTIAVVLKEE